jgi:hypothetical protein
LVQPEPIRTAATELLMRLGFASRPGSSPSLRHRSSARMPGDRTLLAARPPVAVWVAIASSLAPQPLAHPEGLVDRIHAELAPNPRGVLKSAAHDGGEDHTRKPLGPMR